MQFRKRMQGKDNSGFRSALRVGLNIMKTWILVRHTRICER